MKLLTIFDLLSGRRDIRSLKILNEYFGKGCFFIEQPHIYLEKIKTYLKDNNVKEIFILTPENYNDMILPKSPNTSLDDFKRAFNEVVRIAKQKGITLILHLHLTPHPQKIPYNEKLKRTKKALEYLTSLGVEIKEVGFGWWRSSHRDPEIKSIAQKLGLKLSKRRFHVYDFWLI